MIAGRALPGWARWVTRASLAGAAIALVATVWIVGPSTIGRQIAAIGPWFAVLVAIEIATTACDAVALRAYLGPDDRPSYLAVVRAQIAGRAVNAVMPLGGLGEVAKMTALMTATSSERAVAAVVHYDLSVVAMSLVAIAAGAPVCAAALDLPAWLAITLVSGAAIAAILLVGGVVLVRRGMLASVADALAWSHVLSRRRLVAWRARLARIDDLLRPGHARRGARAAIAWIFASRVLSWLSVWVVLAATGHFVGVGTMAAMATAGLVISWGAMIVPMGLGLSDGGNVALFAALGESASLGVTVMLGQRAILLLYAAVGIALTATTASRAAASRAAATTPPSAALEPVAAPTWHA